MKIILMIAIMLNVFNAFAYTDPKVGGIVNFDKKYEAKLKPTGVLYIFAFKDVPDPEKDRKTGPIATLRIEKPIFPQAFVVTQKHVKLAGFQLPNPVHILARYSPRGDLLISPETMEGVDADHLMVDLGMTDLKIELKPHVVEYKPKKVDKNKKGDKDAKEVKEFSPAPGPVTPIIVKPKETQPTTPTKPAANK